MSRRRSRFSISYEVYEMRRREGRYMGKLSELQIDKVASQKEILKKQLDEDDIPSGLRTELQN